MLEWLDVVDENGNPTGKTVTRTEAHRDGIPHRTSHVWLVRWGRGGPELLLQKRCAAKDSFPGCYDISSAGHIPAGQGFVDSALRELREELGVNIAAADLQPLGLRRFAFCRTFHGHPFHDRQVSMVYALPMDRPAEQFAVQAAEIESVRWMPLADCARMVKTGTPANCVAEEELEMLAAWFEDAAPARPCVAADKKGQR